MYRDRKLVKEHIIKLRFDEYEVEQINDIVNEFGGHRAAILHDLLIEALNSVSATQDKRQINNKKHA